MTYSPSAPMADRLQSLRALVVRKPIVRRMPLPAGIELYSFEWAILRGQWRKHFGQGAIQ